MSASETCSRCGQEVRWGRRRGVEGYLHREDVDHIAIFGRIQTDEDRAEIERQMDLPRERQVKVNPSGLPLLFEIETYTTREHDLARYRKNAKFRAAEELEEDDNDEEVEVELPPIEAYATPVDVTTLAPRSGIRQIINLIAKRGWELRACKRARGPYLGAKGQCLSISDTIVVKGRGPEQLDGGVPIAVASWRDGKFDFAFIGTIKDGNLSPSKVDATSLKAWIKIKGIQ